MFKCIFLIILCSILSQQLYAVEGWTQQTFREDVLNHYYVGVSEGKKELNDAMEEAYQNAIGEGIRHNFGFLKEEQRTIQSDLYRTTVDERSFIKSQNVVVKDVKPGRHYIATRDNGTYLVYREVIYPKSSIESEKKRIKKTNEKAAPLNAYGIQGKVMGEILIRTKPSTAQIILTRVDGRGSVVGTGDAKFKVPLGKYHISIIKDGHIPLSDEVIVSGRKSNYQFELKPALGFLNINIRPSNSKIYLNNMAVKNKTRLSLQVGQDYVLRVEHGDYETYVENINPWIGQEINFNRKLKAKPGRMTIISQPIGAKVLIDGVVIGRTPLTHFSYKSEINFDLKVQKKGYASKIKSVILKANEDLEPLVFSLKKAGNSPKKFIKKSKNNDLFILSNNLSKHNLMYSPVILDDTGASYMLVPIQYQYFSYRHLAFGIDYRHHIEEENVTIQGEQFDKEDITQIWSLNSTIYLVRNKYFSLGFGPEYTWRKSQVKYYYPDSDQEVYSNSLTEKGLGYKALAQIGLLQRNNGHRFGINIDYRHYDYKDPKLKSWSFGLYWEF